MTFPFIAKYGQLRYDQERSLSGHKDNDFSRKWRKQANEDVTKISIFPSTSL